MYSERSETFKMELFAKLIPCIKLLTIFAKHFIISVSKDYEYASYKTKQNPGELSLISQKIRTAIFAISFHF